MFLFTQSKTTTQSFFLKGPLGLKNFRAQKMQFFYGGADKRRLDVLETLGKRHLNPRQGEGLGTKTHGEF